MKKIFELLPISYRQHLIKRLKLPLKAAVPTFVDMYPEVQEYYYNNLLEVYTVLRDALNERLIGLRNEANQRNGFKQGESKCKTTKSMP